MHRARVVAVVGDVDNVDSCVTGVSVGKPVVHVWAVERDNAVVGGGRVGLGTGPRRDSNDAHIMERQCI